MNTYLILNDQPAVVAVVVGGNLSQSEHRAAIHGRSLEECCVIWEANLSCSAAKGAAMDLEVFKGIGKWGRWDNESQDFFDFIS